MRLIDAVGLRTEVDMLFAEKKISPNTMLIMKKTIDYYPIAFDMEKVVEQLKTVKVTALDKVRMIVLIIFKRDLQKIVDICFDEAIRIVRKGGVE
jgi:hypothetical protein